MRLCMSGSIFSRSEDRARVRRCGLSDNRRWCRSSPPACRPRSAEHPARPVRIWSTATGHSPRSARSCSAVRSRSSRISRILSFESYHREKYTLVQYVLLYFRTIRPKIYPCDGRNGSDLRFGGKSKPPRRFCAGAYSSRNHSTGSCSAAEKYFSSKSGTTRSPFSILLMVFCVTSIPSSWRARASPS